MNIYEIHSIYRSKRVKEYLDAEMLACAVIFGCLFVLFIVKCAFVSHLERGRTRMLVEIESKCRTVQVGNSFVVDSNKIDYYGACDDFYHIVTNNHCKLSVDRHYVVKK